MKYANIVKRKGHLEPFDERKVYASCYEACISASLKKQQAEKICSTITRDVKKWIGKKEKVASNQIFRLMVKLLKKHDKEVAFLYETHRDIS